MPNVSPYELKGNTGAGFVNPTYVKGHNGSGFQFGYAVYVHNGSGWVEVWNARPEVVSTSMATTGSGLTFSGTADPNNFSTTAKFEYKEVGGSYSNSTTTSSGMGDGVDSAVSFTVTASVGDTYKNWESRASATNAGGTGTGSTITLDCRKSGPTWGTNDSTNASTCDSCGTVTTRTYTRSSCQAYSEVVGNCTPWADVTATGTFNGEAYTATTDFLGNGPYMTKNSDVRGNCDAVGGSLYDQCYTAEYCSASGLYRVIDEGCIRTRFK